MKYCKKCVMPDTRSGIIFDSDGVCSACNNYEKQKSTDWKARWAELEKICDKYRGLNGPDKCDCAIAVSGGKDSHFQVHVMKELMGMNPLLISVSDNQTMTEAGKHNIDNISEEFDCEMFIFKPNIAAQKKIMRKTFELYGKPTWPVDRYIYTVPLHVATKFNLPLLVYGENVSFTYGGNEAEETYSAKNLILNGVASDIPEDVLLSSGITSKDLQFLNPPDAKELDNLDPIYLSYYLPWNSYSNYIFAKSRGFHDLTHEWDRTHHIENFDQVDSYSYLVHSWMKYPKFGHQAATDYAARYIRYGLLTRDEGIRLVREHDNALDPLCVRHFCDFTGYSETEFWRIVDKFYNRDIFEKDMFGRWVLKNPIWKE